MKKTDEIISIYKLLLREFLKQFAKEKDNSYIISLEYVEIDNFDSQQIYWLFRYIYNKMSLEKIYFLISLSHNNRKIIFKEIDNMEELYYFDIDYMHREKYIDYVCDINSMVSKDGMVTLYVSNMPGHLKARLAIISNDMEERKLVMDYLTNNEITILQDKTLSDFIKEIGNRIWNSHTFPPYISKQEIKIIYNHMFWCKSEKELLELGYNFQKNSYKPKVFISYAWKNKDIVYPIVDNLENNGTNIWIDKQSIDYGDNILESILSGLHEADLIIFFISTDFKASMMARKEIISIWTDVISNKKKWIIVRLDNINPEEVYYSLSHIKYLDLNGNDDIGELLKIVKKKLRDIISEK